MLTIFFEQIYVDIVVRPPHRLGAVNNTSKVITRVQAST
jgi:hypothetical protein